MTGKRIISLLLALSVILGSVISLSSCGAAFEEWLGNYAQEDDKDPTDNPSDNDGKNESSTPDTLS